MLPPVTPLNPKVPVFVPTDITSPNVQFSVPSLWAKGSILVTVKRPSNLAIVTIPYGKISIAPDGVAPLRTAT